MRTHHPEALHPAPPRWIAMAGALGGGALATGTAAFALGSLAIVADLDRGASAIIGLVATIGVVLGGLGLGVAWLGLVVAGRGGVTPMLGSLLVASAVIAAQLIGDGGELVMAKGLIVIGGLIVCAMAHVNLPRERFRRGIGAVRGGATLALVGLAVTTMAYSRSIELPLALAVALVVAGLLGAAVLGSGLAVGFASLGGAAHPADAADAAARS